MTLVLLFTIVVCCSCTKNDLNQAWKGESVTTPGNYVDSTHNRKLVIDEENGLVNYHLLSLNNDTLVKTKYSFSDTHRWRIQMDGNRFWVYSSDIGTFAWELDSRNVYNEIVLPTQEDYLRIMPKDLYEFLPSRLKAK